MKMKERLEEELEYVGVVAIYKLIQKYKKHVTIIDLPSSRPQENLMREQLVFADNSLADNDELTARQIHKLLVNRWPGLTMLLSTMKRARKHFG